MPVQEPEADVEVRTVEATIELRVPRGAMGDLPAGVREVLANVEGVEAVDVGGIEGVRPTSFDIYVDAAARLDLAVSGDPEAVEAHLLDGFGVEGVDALVVDYG